ncbi:ATPase [Sphingobium boeckii]|uniref:ATP synthase subunit b n=1 Tax=Sphingobium boeckii TaxID=1082345 RepID=A0A7W9AK26_9SPHN|nr:ATPase [Sphingobium boeckii]MBB5687013.1 F-type H+-transporting ATPase subunit b [Sphingobium boeckii]
MPQIAQIAATYASQIFWLLLIFGAVFFVIGLGMVPKVQSTVDARDKQIAGDLAAAEQARKDADAREEAYRAKTDANRAEALKVTQAAKAKGIFDSETALAKADAEIADTVSAAEARIKAASDAASAGIETIAAEAAQAMVARLSGANITPAQAAIAVKAALANG